MQRLWAATRRAESKTLDALVSATLTDRLHAVQRELGLPVTAPRERFAMGPSTVLPPPPTARRLTRRRALLGEGLFAVASGMYLLWPQKQQPTDLPVGLTKARLDLPWGVAIDHTGNQLLSRTPGTSPSYGGGATAAIPPPCPWPPAQWTG